MRNVLPLNTMAIAMGLHVRVRHRGQPVGQTQGPTMSSRAAGRAAGAHRPRAAPRGGHRRAGARPSTRSATHYSSADETLAKAGLRPQPPAGERGAPLRLRGLIGPSIHLDTVLNSRGDAHRNSHAAS
ncbi:MAG: 3-keto-5-aminohexanoate cleavage protein [Chromatiales bacterium]|nr:3-keto-5-aminohexanoate cleavage protein [Chromatiales bacterium]